MKVLSLFDGMSCGMIALERAAIKVDQYYASEIDKHAVEVSKTNYPNIIHLGDIRIVRQMAQHGHLGHIDLVIGGSPCQGFSFAGKQLAFNDPRSSLFFEYVWTLEALKKTNPNIKFLLENVRMKKQFLDVVTQFLGVEPHFINSNLLSAQNRQRYYWYNWKVEDPVDKGILLKDIVEPTFDEKYLCNEKELKRLLTSEDVKKRFSSIDPEKAQCMIARQYDNWRGNFITVKQKGRGINPGFIKELKKSPSMTASRWEQNVHISLDEGINFRKLTPVECERLQTVPDNYTACVSDTQRYKMLGNGWTVDVVAHILKGLK